MKDRWDVVPVRGADELARREDAWRRALSEAATERLFLEPEWVLPWFEVFDAPARALLVEQRGLARSGAILTAVRLGPDRFGPLVLRPPGLGVSDYLDLLLPSERGAAEETAGALLDWLIGVGGWDLLDLPNLPDEWPTAELMSTAAAARGLETLRLPMHARPFVALEGSWENYLAARPRKLRYNLRARRRQLAALGETRYRHYTTPDAVAAQLERAVGVHARRWAGQQTSTTFSRSATARRFYAQACERMAGRGWIDLSTLELDGRLLAFCLGFVYGGKWYYYLPAFEPEYARYGPSTDLLAHLIETAYARGLREVDFMLGDEPYKDQWATGRRGTTRLVVAALGARGRAALAGFRGYLAVRERARGSAAVQWARRYGVGAVRGLIARR